MATRLKTVEFAMPVLAALVDNTLTTLTQITVYLPETGTKTFRSVVATMSAVGTSTAVGNVTSRQVQCRLGAAGYTANTNANLYTGSGEDIILFHGVDLTSHFTTNWTGTSMTFDAQVLIDGTGTGIAWTNVNVTLSVTYEYDDTSTTQIKTVRIPLNAPVGAFAATKPGTATATIPALNTELPEASKVYRNQHIVVQGNTHLAAATDSTLTMQLDATAAHTSGTFEGLSATDAFFRYVWDCSAVLDESISMGFYLWGSATKFNHVQAWLVVTYEFDSTSANDVFVSLLIPSSGGLAGQPASTDFLRVAADFRVPESGLVQKQSAYYAFWTTTGVTAGLNMRFGTGSFVAYTDQAAVLAGTNAAMIRNDSAYTLAQGLNTVSADVYSTETTVDFPGAYNGFFIINYTCDKPTGGHGAVTHSVHWWMKAPYNGASINIETVAAWAPVIPESDYFITGLGPQFDFYANSTQGGFAPEISVERLSGEPGGQTWDRVCGFSAVSDFESGLYITYIDCEDMFFQWPGDIRAGKTVRRDLETARRWRAVNVQQVAMWDSFSLWFTYHAQTWTVSGTVSGSAGGTVTITLHDATTHEALKSTTRVGNGSYSFTWYDTVRSVYVTARETDVLTMRTGNGVAV